MFKINMISPRERLFTQGEIVHPERDCSPREIQEVMK
jgi:hypothetical protein